MTTFFVKIIDNFFCDLTNELSVFTDQISSPSYIEKHFKIFLKSVTKIRSSYTLICELKGAELFFIQIKFPVATSTA